MGVDTLLVDTDLRRPVIDDLFQVKESPGLTDVLLGKASLESAIQKSQVEHLSILSTGALPPNPSELLASQKMGDLVAQAKARYGMVLFDSPPVVAVTDAAVLSRWADAVLLVVRMSRTDRGLAQRAKELLENVRAKVVGTVMNDVKLEAGYGGYHYYYYYHYYGSQEKARHKRKK
jgi:capsular exopolysaccharide synthesis family protein